MAKGINPHFFVPIIITSLRVFETGKNEGTFAKSNFDKNFNSGYEQS